MISDVPLGAFFSGGIDSSLNCSFDARKFTKPVETFTIGFNEEQFNEAKYAKKIANFLGTNHNEYYLSQEEILKTVPFLPDIYDEPFSDSSQIPTTLISKFASNKVSVCLSGDGGDEIFAGYNRYSWVKNIWK